MITLTEENSWSRQYRVEDERGFCRFSLQIRNVSGRDPLRLSTFGGSVWPDSFPDVFEAHGADADGRMNVMASQCYYTLRTDVALPTEAVS